MIREFRTRVGRECLVNNDFDHASVGVPDMHVVPTAF